MSSHFCMYIYFSGGGIPTKNVTEIAGQSGVGKTQLCLQLCANVQLPEKLGGLDGNCIYLDCHGGFSSQRLQQIIEPTKEMAINVLKEMKEDFRHLKAKDFLAGVVYRRISDVEDLVKALDYMAEHILPENDSFRLLVIDRLVLLHVNILDWEKHTNSLLHEKYYVKSFC